MRIFVINLDRAKDRWEYYKHDERFTRWSATDYTKLNDNNPIFKDMVSYWNIDPCKIFLVTTKLRSLRFTSLAVVYLLKGNLLLRGFQFQA